MDFTRPQPEAPAASAPFKAAASRFYDKSAAAQVFRQHGREERFAAGEVLFEEADKASRGGMFRAGSRMYYLAEGEVALAMGGRSLDIVKPGEVFGEMAVISGQPRSATATARTAGSAHSMDAAELQAAIGREPAFALMLASVMYDRLRFLGARLATRGPRAPAAPREATTFDPALVGQLAEAMPATSITRYAPEAVIMREGQSGTFMYVVRRGRVGIFTATQALEVVQAGGTFGEMAIVDQSPRTANAKALEDTELLALDRASLLALVGRHPAVGIAVLRSIADRLRYMNQLLR